MRSTKSRSWTDGGLLAPGGFLFRALGLEPVPAPPHVFALEPGRLRYGRFARHGAAVFGFEEQRSAELSGNLFSSGALAGALREPAELESAVGELLEGLSSPVEHASLVLPDAWLRLAFVETGDLPRGLDARDDVLRWKLKRILPVRVEDLRLDAVPALPLPAQQEPRRWLVGFALESLLGSLEAAFAAHGIWIGRVTNESLAVLPAVAGQIEGEATWCLVTVHRGGYTLLFARGDQPILHRFRSLDPALSREQHEELVVRDLRLTRAYFQEQLPEVPLAGVLLVSRDEEKERWLGWLTAELGEPAQAVGLRHLPITATHPLAWREIAPLLGAAAQEIP